MIVALTTLQSYSVQSPETGSAATDFSPQSSVISYQETCQVLIDGGQYQKILRRRDGNNRLSHFYLCFYAFSFLCCGQLA